MEVNTTHPPEPVRPTRAQFEQEVERLIDLARRGRVAAKQVHPTDDTHGLLIDQPTAIPVCHAPAAEQSGIPDAWSGVRYRYRAAGTTGRFTSVEPGTVLPAGRYLLRWATTPYGPNKDRRTTGERTITLDALPATEISRRLTDLARDGEAAAAALAQLFIGECAHKIRSVLATEVTDHALSVDDWALDLYGRSGVSLIDRYCSTERPGYGFVWRMRNVIRRDAPRVVAASNQWGAPKCPRKFVKTPSTTSMDTYQRALPSADETVSVAMPLSTDIDRYRHTHTDLCSAVDTLRAHLTGEASPKDVAKALSAVFGSSYMDRAEDVRFILFDYLGELRPIDAIVAAAADLGINVSNPEPEATPVPPNVAAA